MTFSGTMGPSWASSFLALMKLEPASLRRWTQSPLTAWKRLKASIKEAVSNGPDDHNINNAPEEAKALCSHINTDESELSGVYPNEHPTLPCQKVNYIAQKPKPPQEILTEEEISSLQDTVSALLNKIQTIRQDKVAPLNAQAPPFISKSKQAMNQTSLIPTPSSVQTTQAQIHSPPPMKWEQCYSHTYNDQGHIKHALKNAHYQ